LPGAGDIFNLLGGDVLIARNPTNPNEFAAVDPVGLLYLVNIATGERRRMEFSPFSQFAAGSFNDNKTQVREIAWAPDGAALAFRITSNEAGRNDGNDGVWYWQREQTQATDPTFHLLRDCPPGCGLVSNPSDPDQWIARTFTWSPNSGAVLIEVDLPTEGRRGIVVSQRRRDSEQARTRPPVCRYDTGNWADNGQQIIASGNGPNGQPALHVINQDCSVVNNIGTSGLWMQNAVERPNGQIVALGSPNGQNSAMRLYAANGNPLSDVIGDGPPQRVTWNAARDSVLVVVNGRTFVVQLRGGSWQVNAL